MWSVPVTVARPRRNRTGFPLMISRRATGLYAECPLYVNRAVELDTMKWRGETTGVGSLPHESVEAALAFSFAHDLPFLPQLPVGHPNELMLAAATAPSLEPVERAWALFLEQLERRATPVAKLQLAGPVTLRRYAKFDDVSWLIAKALFQLEALTRRHVQPVFFIDEPDLTEGSLTHLEALINALKQAGAITGIHCCGNAKWADLMSMPSLDVVSFDAQRSLGSVLSVAQPFLARAGTLAYGLDPGQPLAQPASSYLLTTTCGLANASVFDAQQRLETLKRAQKKLADVR